MAATGVIAGSVAAGSAATVWTAKSSAVNIARPLEEVQWRAVDLDQWQDGESRLPKCERVFPF